MNEKGIEFINVSKTYRSAGKEITALQDISLSIQPGEYIGLMGMNGSGKSTLARLCNGLIKPTEGKVYVNGMDSSEAQNIPHIRQLVGMVFQNPDNQLICPVVEEEIAFGLENLGLPIVEIKRRVEWALETMGLTAERHHAPHLLSGGQKQKVALASVLAMMPDYLILDEPTAMLDPLSRWELLEHLNALKTQKGMTIILSSHNPEDLVHADRLVVIDQGSLFLLGTPREVCAREAELAAIGLQPPDIYQLMRQLAETGHPVADQVKTIAELVDMICQK